MHNLTYQTYLVIDIVPTLLVIFAAPVLFIPVLGILCLYKLIRRCSYKNLLGDKSFVGLFEFLGKYALIDMILHRSKAYPQQFVVAGFRAPKSYIFWLFSLLYGTAAFAGARFWDNFLLQESTTCNPADTELSCFSFPANLYDYPVDCSDTEYFTDNNLTEFICFKFTLDFGNASGAAGGTLVLTFLVITIITVNILKCSNAKYSTLPQRIVIIAVQIVGIIVTLTMPVILYFTPILGDLVYRSIDSILQLIAVIMLVLIVMTTPWCLFVSDVQLHDPDASPGLIPVQLPSVMSHPMMHSMPPDTMSYSTESLEEENPSIEYLFPS